MNKYLLIIVLLLTQVSCIGYYKLSNNQGGEPILNKRVNYKFIYIPKGKDLIKIDTSAYYVQKFEGRYYNEGEKQNPQVLLFHNDGFFKSTFVKHLLEAKNRKKNSVYYGGKYRISNNSVELEQFYPMHGGKTKYYSRNITKGVLKENKIIFDDGQSLMKVFEKRNRQKP